MSPATDKRGESLPLPSASQVVRWVRRGRVSLFYAIVTPAPIGKRKCLVGKDTEESMPKAHAMT